jgi:hypothetical protein
MFEREELNTRPINVEYNEKNYEEFSERLSIISHMFQKKELGG